MYFSHVFVLTVSDSNSLTLRNDFRPRLDGMYLGVNSDFNIRLNIDESSPLYPFGRLIPDLKPDCRQMLNRFAESAANFTFCMLLNARPISICRFCIKTYFKMTNIFNNITENSDNDECKSDLLSCDRLIIVQANYESLNNIWNKAKCSACLTKSDNGSDIPHPTNETQEFFHKLTNVISCLMNDTQVNSTVKAPNDYLMGKLNSASADDLCKKCESVYSDLNTFYDSVNTEYNNQICFDIVDAMNITRHLWNRQYKCAQSSFEGLPVLLLSGAVGLLPVLFYLAVRFGSNARESALMPQKRMSFVQSSHSNSMQSIQR